MSTDDYNPLTALTAYYTSRDERRLARLWAAEKLLHDLKAAGFVDFFEGPGNDPTGIAGYAVTKVWLRVSSGVTPAPGEVRAYDAGDPSLLASWPVLSGAGFAKFLGVVGDMLKALYDPTHVEGDAFDRSKHHGTQSVATITGLGSAAAAETGDFASAGQGALAESAVQPDDLATDATAGLVEKATVAEVRSAAADKYISADLVPAASAAVALADAGTIALDWTAGFYREVTLTASRTLGNPSNGQSGTFRTVYVAGNSGTPRTLSFGNQYGGDLPTLDDITNTKTYLITIFCRTASHFVIVGVAEASPP